MTITINKDNSSLSININTLQVIDMLSKQTDYISDKSKAINIYYNITYNCLYLAAPVSLERYLGWGTTERESITRWINSFADYGTANCLQAYINWLNGNFSSYTILYGQLDVIGSTSKPLHLIIDARFRCTASICVGVYDKGISVVGLQQVIATDLQKALQDSKHIRIDNGRFAVIV